VSRHSADEWEELLLPAKFERNLPRRIDRWSLSSLQQRLVNGWAPGITG
jgi:hypothetical protein